MITGAATTASNPKKQSQGVAGGRKSVNDGYSRNHQQIILQKSKSLIEERFSRYHQYKRNRTRKSIEKFRNAFACSQIEKVMRPRLYALASQQVELEKLKPLQPQMMAPILGYDGRISVGGFSGTGTVSSNNLNQSSSQVMSHEVGFNTNSMKKRSFKLKNYLMAQSLGFEMSKVHSNKKKQQRRQQMNQLGSNYKTQDGSGSGNDQKQSAGSSPKIEVNVSYPMKYFIPSYDKQLNIFDEQRVTLKKMKTVQFCLDQQP